MQNYPANPLGKPVSRPLEARRAVSGPPGALVVPGGSCGFLATPDGVRFYCPSCGGTHGENRETGQRLLRRMAVYHDPNAEGVVILSCWDCGYLERISLVSIPEGVIFDAVPSEDGPMREYIEEELSRRREKRPLFEETPVRVDTPALEGARRVTGPSNREIVDG